MNAREEILARIQTSLADLPDREQSTPIDWEYGRPTDLPDVLERFVDRIEDYQARVVRTNDAELPQTIARTLAEECDRVTVPPNPEQPDSPDKPRTAKTVVVPGGLPIDWCKAIADNGIEVLPDTAEAPLTHAQLDAVSGVVTASRVSIAETGTIVLDHTPDQGRRALSLLPDLHICVVRADSVVSDVPEAVAILRSSIAARHPLTWISGGSATSDIELERVDGVHGPRRLVVILVQ